MFIGLGLSLTAIGRALDAYAIAGFSPKLVFAPTADVYRTGGSASTFAGMIDYTGASNKTMVDSDGVLKWAPHNTVTYSEATTGWATFAGVNPLTITDGVFTVEETTDNSGHAVSTTLLLSAQTTGVIEIKANGRTKGGFDLGTASGTYRANFDLSAETIDTAGSAVISSSITALGDGWYRLSMTATNSNTFRITIKNDAGLISYTGDGASGFLFRLPHAYRSDLGGMADNPDTGNSYVPTTSAARYLSRRGHHVWNGSEWVNAGMLVEPTAATNLVTYSEDFTNAAWTKTDASFTGGKLIEEATTAEHLLLNAVNIVAGTIYTAFYDLEAAERTWAYVHFGVAAFSGAKGAYFNLSSGTIGTVDAGASAAIVNLGGGVFRCIVTATATDTRSGAARVSIAQSDGVRNYAGDGTSGIIPHRAQLEVGSVPSSYIPTAGSTATRAAETVSIAAAKVPFINPDNLGAELVTNGDFATGDLTGWADISVGTGTATVNGSDQLELYRLDVSNRGRIMQDITFTTGTQYVVNFTKVDSSASVQCKAGSVDPDAATNLGQITAAGQYSFIFSSTRYLHFLNVSNGTTAVIDNISVREVTALELSIAMRGRMTYAQGNIYNPTFISWASDGANYILVRNRNTLTPLRTGAAAFQQAVSGVIDVVEEVLPGSYSPGINVPFSIASRHGSTFINGAVDGTALTADLTPTSLPNLSATPLSLAQSGGPMIIEEFAMWDVDLGDAGIEEASS